MLTVVCPTKDCPQESEDGSGNPFLALSINPAPACAGVKPPLAQGQAFMGETISEALFYTSPKGMNF